MKTSYTSPVTRRRTRRKFDLCPSSCTGFRADKITLGNKDIKTLARYADENPDECLRMIKQLAGRLKSKFHTGGIIHPGVRSMFGERAEPFLAPAREEAIKTGGDAIRRAGDAIKKATSGKGIEIEITTPKPNDDFDWAKHYSEMSKRTHESFFVPGKRLGKSWAAMVDYAAIERRVMAQMGMETLFNIWLLYAVDKHLCYNFMYDGAGAIQKRLDEEGCGALIAAAKEAEGVWDD